MESLSPFEAAEIAFDKVVSSERVAKVQQLESILSGNGEYATDVAFELWQSEMVALGFADHAYDSDDE